MIRMSRINFFFLRSEVRMLSLLCLPWRIGRLVVSLLLSVLIVATLGVVLYGSSFLTYAQVKGEDFAENFGPSTETELRMIDKDLDHRATGEIRNTLYKASVVEQTANLKRQAHKTACLELTAIKKDVKTMREELTDPNRQSFLHGGKEYSREELKFRLADTLILMADQEESVKSTEEMASATASTAQTLNKAASTKVRTVQKTRADVVKAQARLATIEAKKMEAQIANDEGGIIAESQTKLSKINAKLTAEEKMLGNGSYQRLDSHIGVQQISEQELLAKADAALKN